MSLAALLLAVAALPSLAGVCECEVVSLVGGGPSFAPHQQSAVVAPLGHAATLYCTVMHLGDKSVSWVRSRDLQILSHAGFVFTADARVSAAATGARHALRIERLRATDAGRYECQVNTEPKLSLFFNLTVVDEPVPVVVVTGLEGGEAVGAVGGTTTLSCEARYEPPPRLLPLPPLELQWRRHGEALRLAGARGVALDTERWAARLVSRLTLAELRADDAGEYVCAVGERAASVILHLVTHEAAAGAEAMQRDEGAGGSARRTATSSTLAAICVAIAMAIAR